MPVRFRFMRLCLPALLVLCACDPGTVHIVRFPSGEIREMWTEKGREGKPTRREGLFRSFFPDGRAQSAVDYRAGKKHGSARMWDASGNLIFHGEYREDFLVRETRYDRAGNVSAEKRFTLKTERVKAIGSAGGSVAADETCAWSAENGSAPVKHGLCSMMYGNGRPMADRYYRAGRLHGPVKAWFEDGTPWLEGAYDMGIPAGKWRTWGSGGNPLWKAGYANGEKDGVWEEWYPDGSRKSKTGYARGKADGEYREWYPKGGTRLQGRFRAGKRDGVENAWYPDGSRLYSARYAGGRLDGEFFQWHPGGRLRLHCRFAKGAKEGASRIWYPKGGLQELAYYKQGRLNGSYRTWNPDGAPMAMKEFRDGAVAFDSKAKELLELLGADQLRVPVGILGFYWGMAAKECRANLGLYQAANVRADSGEIKADIVAFPDRKATSARIRLSFNGQGELWGIRLDLRQRASGDFFTLCENLEMEMGAELGTAGLSKTQGGTGYAMTRKRDWGRFSMSTGGGLGIHQELPVVSAEGFSPGDAGWLRFVLANHLYREYVDPANTAITPPRWQEESFLAGR
jgi:antitoxin component YwqK of YwqJK toxin-antitoxin module